TDLGLATLATSQEPVAGRLVGIRLNRISMLTWGAAGFLGGLAGVLLAPVTAQFAAGYGTTGVLISAFTAAVLGGMTSVPGAFVVWYVLANKPFRADELSAGVIIDIGALSLNVLVGYTGQISLGHQAFIGIGAFSTAYVFGHQHYGFYVGLLAGAVVGAVQAVLLGLIALRVRGLYFALVTLAWGFVAEN